MRNKSLTIEQILTMLSAAPAQMAGYAEGLSPEQLIAPPAPGEWSLRDILAHLRACSDMWGGYIERIQREDHPTLKAVSPRTWIRHTDYCQQEFHPSLLAYTDQRAGLLALLEGLAPEDWDRTATMTGAGKPLERSLYDHAEGLAVHERPHLKQIERAANRVR